MPELPEVETIRRVLEPQVRGLTIEGVTVRRPEVIARPAAAEFCEALAGQALSAVTRRGKFLCFLLESGDSFVLHLRMTGCLLLTPGEYPEEPHTHVIFGLRGGGALRFSDPRRFGRLWLLRKGEIDTYSGIRNLGLEPFDEGLTADYLLQHFGRRKKAVKECLLDQSLIAGIGNIYSDEILFASGIHPARPARELTRPEIERLAAAIPERLSYFIEKNALTPEEYLAGKGRDYRNTPFLQVYGQRGKPCPGCGAELRRMTLGGRSSVYCPRCQPPGGGAGGNPAAPRGNACRPLDKASPKAYAESKEKEGTPMEIGTKGTSELTVTEEMLANRVGSGLVEVYATPMMIAGLEGTAAASVAGFLEEGQTTVGCRMNVSHVAATPAGMKVRFETELTGISPNGKMLTFRVAAYDEAGLIGEGEHQRAIVWKARFEEKAQAKRTAR